MKNQVKKWGLFFVILFLFVSFAFAETVVLKSGERIEGKVIEKTDKYIKIDFQGVALPFFWEDIERVEGAQEGPALTNSYDAYFSKGTKLIKQRLFDEAIIKLQEAIKLDPAQPGAHNNLGVAFACKKDYPQAIEEFKKAAEREKSNYLTIINYNLAYVYVYAGLIKEAEETAKQVTINKVDLLRVLIFQKETGGDVITAPESTSLPPDTFAFAPESKDKEMERGAKAAGQERGEDVFVIENFPLLFLYHSPLSFLNLALSNNPSEAKKYLADAAETLRGQEEGVAKKVATVGLHYFRGLMYFHEKDYPAAATDFREAISFYPRIAEFHRALGVSYVMSGDMEKGKQEFNKALELLPPESKTRIEINDFLASI